MSKHGFILIACFVFCLFLNFQTDAVESVVNTKVESPVVKVNLSNSEVDQIAGQFIIMGISGSELTELERNAIRTIKPGGIILFRRNIISFQQLLKLNLELQKISYEVSGRPLLISTDQEGGRVARLKISPAMPSALAMGLTNDPKLVEDVSFESARLLKALGINMNLAPVLDILMDNTTSFIGERSFGTNS